MKSTDKHDRKTIELLAQAYRHADRKVTEASYGYNLYDHEGLHTCQLIKEHIERVIAGLDRDSKLIAMKEIIEGCSFGWHTDFYSTSTYFRIRKKCYRIILSALQD